METVDLQGAIEILQRGKILVYPTETCYGLGVDPFQPEALQSLLEIKGRDPTKPISILMPSKAQLIEQAREISPVVKRLMEQFLPGPLTLILCTQGQFPAAIAGPNGEVGFRVSSHSLTQALMTQWSGPLTTTSANIAGRPSGHTRSQIHEYFGACEEVYFLDGGDLPASRGSTVVRVSGSDLHLLRHGDIALDDFNL